MGAIFAGALICGIVAAFIARAKGRSMVGWFFAGLASGIVGVIIIASKKRMQPSGPIPRKLEHTPSKPEYITSQPQNVPATGFEDRSEMSGRSRQISVTEEDFITVRNEIPRVTEHEIAEPPGRSYSVTTEPVSTTELSNQTPLRITPEDFGPVFSQAPLKITPKDFERVSVQQEQPIRIGPEDFEESPASQPKLTKRQEMPSRTKSIRVGESDFITKSAVKSIAEEAGKAAGMSLKAKVLTFIVIATAGGGAFVAYEGGLGPAKMKLNYTWTKLTFSASRASPEEVCKMYVLACWKGDRNKAMSLLSRESQQIMSEAERQQDQWRRSQLERLHGRTLSDREWGDIKAQVMGAESQMLTMFEGSRLDFDFVGSQYDGSNRATVDMQARIRMKGPFFENWKGLIQKLSQSDPAGDKVSNFMAGFFDEFGSKWWKFKFLLIREGNAWKIDDIEMPIGEILESMFDSFDKHSSRQTKVQKSPTQIRRSTEPTIVTRKAPPLPKVTEDELEYYRKSFMKKLALAGADDTTQNSVRITSIYIRPHGFTRPEIIRTRDRIVFYTWHGKTKRHSSDESPIGSMEFWWASDVGKWMYSRHKPGLVAEKREQIVKDKNFKYWHKIYPR
jgi:hypothetical protein